MTRFFVVLLLALLAACGRQEPTEQDIDRRTDETSQVTGISVRYANSNSLTLDELDALYYSTAACMGLSTSGGPPLPGPAVLFVDPPIDVKDSTITGRYYERIRTAVIDDTLTRTPFLSGTGTDRIVRHEMVHHLKYVTTGNSDPQHKSAAFYDCVGRYTGAL